MRRLDERTVALFGGKIATCVAAARQTAGLLREDSRQPLGQAR
ncbi:hypothetical protein ACFU99_12205 [Streptomyces sp. NPDC057654]